MCSCLSRTLTGVAGLACVRPSAARVSPFSPRTYTRRTLKVRLLGEIFISSSLFYLVTVACKDSDLHLREQFTVRHFSRQMKTHDRYLCQQVISALPEEWSPFWTGRAAEQQPGTPSRPPVCRKTVTWSLPVSVAQMALAARFTVSLFLPSLSVCTALLCVLLNPVPVSCPPSPRQTRVLRLRHLQHRTGKRVIKHQSRLWTAWGLSSISKEPGCKSHT